MKRTTTTLLTLTAILIALVGLNVMFYTDTRGDQESETNGSRSTYSPRLYGTRGFYLLLQHLGYPVSQFEAPLDRLKDSPLIKSLFIIGPPLPYSTEELAALENWVKTGGYLVIADREINWSIAGSTITMITYSKYKQWRLPHIIQPTPFTVGVDKVQLTEFAQGVRAENAPVTSHLGDQRDSVLIDFRYGEGRIVLLGEPYVVANNGIGVSDNLLLLLNIVHDMPAGMIAFDEYHHGYGANLVGRSGLVGLFLNLHDYFKPTPVIGILAQLGLLVGVWIYSRGRRFTRPVPLSEEKRRRSLEYVDSLASLAHRQELRALVVENIHRHTKRRLASLGGSPTIMAGDAPQPTGGDSNQAEMHQWLLKSEQPPQDQTRSDHELLDWVKRLRELETRRRRMK
jgi:hypothetical protein